MKRFFPAAPASAVLLALAVLSSGCGREAFEQVELGDQSTSPGFFEIPARVDILFGQDDTGSMGANTGVINPQMRAFLEQIEGRGWDYHFAVTPLTSRRQISQVAASRFDSNWGALWQPPFPGATADMPGMRVHPSAFRTSQEIPGFLPFSGFLTTQNYAAGANEPGFDAINWALRHSSAGSAGTRFLRDDALLVVFIMSDGDDTSGFSCTDVHSPSCATARENAFVHYRTQLAALKPSLHQLKVYSAVSPQTSAFGGQTCINGNAFRGQRYMRMASELGGQSFDICNQTITSAIDSFAQHLSNVRLAFRTRYVFISNEPNLSRDIRVFKTSGGVEIEIPYIDTDPLNGWSYEGYTTVHAIDSPVPMQLTTGYAIRLNGTSALMGDDTARVEYFIAGGEDSISE
jgi:hypothetical protein